MIGKIITRLYAWYTKRAQEQYIKHKMTEQEQKQAEFYKYIKELHAFITWLHTKGFHNRREKKAFWRDVMAGQPAMENLLKDLMDRYAPPKKEKKAQGYNPPPKNPSPRQKPTPMPPKKK